MTEISFYHLTRTPLEKALPSLLQKILQTDKRAILLAANDGQLESINKLLWTYDPKSFLPHGSKQDGHENDQPIYLTVEEENPNGAEILVIIGGVTPGYTANFSRCLDIFDGQNEDELAQARKRWKQYSNDDTLQLTYWQQNDQGKWERAEL